MFLVMQYMYIFGDSGLLATRLLVQDVRAQAAFNQRLADRNERLRMEIQRIKHDKSVIESMARNDLGMIRPEETFYLYVGDS